MRFDVDSQFDIKLGGTMIGKAHVLESDLFASNGVVHMIDAVLLQKAADSVASDLSKSTVKNIPAVLVDNGLSTLVDLVTKADLAGALSGPGPFTGKNIFVGNFFQQYINFNNILLIEY